MQKARSTGTAVHIVALLAVATSAGIAATAAAADSDANSLDTVVVIGVTPLPGSEEDINNLAAPAQKASAADISRSHTLDISAFMSRELGGVYVNDIQNNPLQPDISYRGYTASPLLGTPQGLSLYLDGVRLNQPFGDVVSWDLIPRQAISTLMLVPGSNPLFGLNTLGGALSLRTKDGFSDPGVSIELNYGSNDRRAITAEVGGHTDRGLYWYATANDFREDGWRDASPSAAQQAFGKLGWRSDRTDAFVSATYADTDLTGNGLQDQQFLANDYASIYTQPDNTRNESWLVNVVGTHAVSDSLSLSANAFYRDIRTSTLNGDINDDSLGESLYQPSAAERAALAEAGYTGFPVSGETQANTPFPSWRCIANILLNSEPNEKCNGLNNRSHTDQHDGGVSAQATFKSAFGVRKNTFTVGATLVSSRAEFSQSSQFGYLTPDRAVATVDGPGAFADGTQDSENAFDARVELTGDTDTRSVFFMDSLQLSSIALLTVSGRYDRTSIDNVDALTPEGDAGSLSGSHRFSRFNPAAGLVVTPVPAFTAYLGYGEGSRAPSAIELGCADPENPCKLPNAMAGDPPLDQVRTRTFEGGFRGTLGSAFAWNAGLFRADNRDDILFVADDQSGFGYFRNFGKTRRKGADLGLKARLGPVTLGANYTYLEATYRSEEELGGEGNSSNEEGPGFEGTIDVAPGDRIPLIPRHILKANAQWDILRQLSVSADLVNVGAAFARGNENNEHEPDDLYYLGEGQTGGYTVVNVGAEFRPVAAFVIYAQLNNALDHQYYTGAQLGSTGFDGAGNFVARPFAGPIVDGERPLLGSTFYAPGAPRSWWLGVRYSLFTQDRR